MRKTMKAFAAGAAIAVTLTGCTQTRIIGNVKDARLTGIVQVLPPWQQISPGQAKLAVEASVKTHKPGYYPLERKTEGIPERPMLLNVDGQTVQVDPTAAEENKAGDPKTDAEAGEGIRYTYARNLALSPGRHVITVTIPEEGTAVVREVVLKEGENSLVARPVYIKTRKSGIGARNGDSRFIEGISSLKLFLNGEAL